VPGGAVSNWFNDEVAQGDVLEVTRPAGVFCVHGGDHPIVAFCGGSGVTPVLSIAKSVLASSLRPVRVLYANRDRESVIFGDQLKAMADRFPGQFDLQHHFDCDGGYVDPGTIARATRRCEDAEFYLCGPTAFMDLVESTLVKLGVDPARILIERFATAPTPPVAAPPVEPEVLTDAPVEVTLILGGTSHTVAYQPGDTLLETARRGGLAAPFSCESGNCATCMAVLREGTASMRANNALTPEEVADGWVLTCQAVPEGPAVTVEYEAL
jgi:3-ketosteroid 9alpha-monooxygenase subunit B